MTKQLAQQDDKIVAERYRLLLQRKNKRQKELYQEKTRQNKFDRLQDQEIKRQELFERALCSMATLNTQFTTNLNFLQFLRESVYTPKDKGCHITMEHMKNYRLQHDIKTQLQLKKKPFSK